MLDSAPPAWERMTLGQVVARGGGSIQTGPFGSQLHASDYVLVGVPSIMPVNIGDNRLIRDGIACISEADANRLAKHVVRKGDIIYSRRGDVERRALVRDEEDGWFCGTGCLKVRLGSGVVLPEFAAYYLGHPEVRRWIVQHAVGATMPNLNTGIMEAIPFLVPPLDEQRAIAGVLGALDDKIEQNRRTARALERLARAIFRAWFVDFEPVKAKAAGAASFPSMPQDVFDQLPTRLVDSAPALGPIPEGWEVGILGDIIEIHDARRIPLSRRQRDERPGPYRYYGAAGVVDHVDAFLFDGVFVLVGEDGTVVAEGDRPMVQYVWGQFWVNNHAHVLTGAACSTEHLRLILDRVNIRPFVTGAVQPKLNQGNLKAVPIIVAPEHINRHFESIVSPLYAHLRQLADESLALTALRDLLLPKLLSGEVRIDHILELGQAR